MTTLFVLITVICLSPEKICNSTVLTVTDTYEECLQKGREYEAGICIKTVSVKHRNPRNLVKDFQKQFPESKILDTKRARKI